MWWVGREARRAGASEREDDDGEKRKLPRTVGAGAPLCWTLGAGLSGSAGPCTDVLENPAASEFEPS